MTFRTLLLKTINKMTAYVIVRCPWTTQVHLIQQLAHKLGPLNAVGCAASQMQSAEILASGSLGLIRGSLKDSTVFLGYALSGTYFAPHLTSIKELLSLAGKGSYLDIGANIGLTALQVAHFPSVQSYCFEAEPENFARLKENIERNAPAAKVSVHHCALSDAPGVLSMTLSSTNFGDHRIQAPGAGDGAVLVPAARLDAVVDMSTLVDPIAIKMDVQGAEALVIAGGRAIFERAKIITFEFSPFHLAALNADMDQIYTLVESATQVAIEQQRGNAADIMRPSPPEAVAYLEHFYAHKRHDSSQPHVDVTLWR